MCDVVNFSKCPDYGRIRELGTEPSIPNSLSFTSAKRSTFLLSWSREVDGSRLRITIETALCRARDGETSQFPDEVAARRAIINQLDPSTFIPLSRAAGRTLGDDLPHVLRLCEQHGSPKAKLSREHNTNILDDRCTAITKAFGHITLYNMMQAAPNGGRTRGRYPSVFYVNPDRWNDVLKGGTDQRDLISHQTRLTPVNTTSLKKLDLAMQEGVGSMPTLEGSEIYLRQGDGSRILIAGDDPSGENPHSPWDPLAVGGTAAQASEKGGTTCAHTAGHLSETADPDDDGAGKFIFTDNTTEKTAVEDAAEMSRDVTEEAWNFLQGDQKQTVEWEYPA